MDPELEITDAAAREVTYHIESTPRNIPPSTDTLWRVGFAIEKDDVRHLWSGASYDFVAPQEGDYPTIT
jgi:hypothetical protein